MKDEVVAFGIILNDGPQVDSERGFKEDGEIGNGDVIVAVCVLFDSLVQHLAQGVIRFDRERRAGRVFILQCGGQFPAYVEVGITVLALTGYN